MHISKNCLRNKPFFLNVFGKEGRNIHNAMNTNDSQWRVWDRKLNVSVEKLHWILETKELMGQPEEWIQDLPWGEQASRQGPATRSPYIKRLCIARGIMKETFFASVLNIWEFPWRKLEKYAFLRRNIWKFLILVFSSDDLKTWDFY